MSWSKTAQASAAALIAALGLVGLSACEEQAYPTPTGAQAPPSASPPADLMGAPEGQGAPPPAAYGPPGQSADAGPPPGPPYPAPPGYGPPASDAPPAYPPGPPVVISNAPIPNPPEPAPRAAHARHHAHAAGRRHGATYEYRARRHGHWVYEPAPAPAHGKTAAHHGHGAVHATPAHGKTSHAKTVHVHSRHAEAGHTAAKRHAAHAVAHHAAAPVKHAHHGAASASPTHTHHAAQAPAAHPAAKAAATPAAPKAPATHTAPKHATATAQPRKIIPANQAPAKPAVVAPLPKVTAPQLQKPKAPPVTPVAPAATATVHKPAAVSKPSNVTTGNTTSSTAAADQTTRLQGFQSALSDLVSREGQLKAPQRFTPNQPVDVTFTLPATFARRLQDEATKAKLNRAAQTVNVVTVLAGDGFSVRPDQTQSLPLTPDQPVQFKWTVTAQSGARGPLHADVSADLQGAGTAQNVPLGAVSKTPAVGGGVTGRVVGISLLVLIAAIVIGWMSQRRRRRDPIGAIRPRSNHHGGDIEHSV